MGGNTVSVAGSEHASSIATIYNPYVETTAITFESEPTNERAFADRIRELTERYPWFVVERDGRTVGYAYASPLRTQAAYRWTVEVSVYVEREWRGEGVGSQLYTALLWTLERQGFEIAYGAIRVPNSESVAFHERFGFERVGLFPNVGYKLGEWHDVAWYERPLGERSAEPTDPIPFSACRSERWLSEILVAASRGYRPGERLQ